MSLENSNSNLPTTAKPWTSIEEIERTNSNLETSKKHTLVNNVLKVLDFPDNQEEIYRSILNKQETNTLIDLATKTKKDILVFILQKKNIDESHQVSTEKVISQNIESKLSKIKSIFTPSILNQNPDIAKKFDELDTLDNPTEKNKVLKEILQTIKEPWRLKAIVNNLWGADKNNPQYVEFKSTLVGLDSSFESIFSDLESESFWVSFNTGEIIDDIETNSDGTVDIDLLANPPVSKLSLIWSNYSFDEEIDKEALAEVMDDNLKKLEGLQKSFALLNGVYTPFDGLINNIRQNWNKQDLNQVLQHATSSFPSSVFDDLGDIYENLDIEPSMQLSHTDILSLQNVTTEAELKTKIGNIKEKFKAIKTTMLEQQAKLTKEHKDDIRQFLKREPEKMKQELEILKFFNACGFSEFPKSITNRIIREFKSGSFSIPWINLSKEYISLKEWSFSHTDNGFNDVSKTNLVKFVNKMLSGDVTKPYPIEAIKNGGFIVDSLDVRSEIEKAWLIVAWGWEYAKVLNNLRKENTI